MILPGMILEIKTNLSGWYLYFFGALMPSKLQDQPRTKQEWSTIWILYLCGFWVLWQDLDIVTFDLLCILNFIVRSVYWWSLFIYISMFCMQIDFLCNIFCFFQLLQMFKVDGFDYFTEMMPALHNYITVDTEGFLSSEARVAAVFEMCKSILTQVSVRYPFALHIFIYGKVVCL